ncbi:FKBP-type peptidyl-prolyl cis-trans isomerase [Tenuifilum thalassicum]|uniref:Peptidyl-prolyl cis-trans isomerase n=1 Tax=Tenuifilum thalassicum TaxID=2590900 RepID=A0A7D3XVB5_9BACT|nr:FKBP-type peptidyl-prolyl cis-trans isomerase [Tenuifilum thalassicum]QKG79788.1 FKBP-type peptidyl-prolyl cis-trans isomerase [Tenuifilum thalassicum]
MKIKQTVFALLGIGLLLSACNNESKLYPGYSVTPTGIHYKLIALGESNKKAEIGNYVTAIISYSTNSDSLFFKGVRQFQLTKPEYEGAIDECFLMLSEGDSASFYIQATPFFEKTLETTLPKFINPDDYMRVDIKLLEVSSEEEFKNQMAAFLSWINDFGEYEKVILKQYLDGQKIDVKPTESGLYIIPKNHSKGPIVEVGDTVTIHYEGRFLNGKFFDSTRKRGEAFQFVYGQKWQVIPGLEEAIGRMREGEKAMLIVPSHLAFGQQGNSNGIIPAFTSVIFNLEIVEVKKGTPNETEHE